METYSVCSTSLKFFFFEDPLTFECEHQPPSQQHSNTTTRKHKKIRIVESCDTTFSFRTDRGGTHSYTGNSSCGTTTRRSSLYCQGIVLVVSHCQCDGSNSCFTLASTMQVPSHRTWIAFSGTSSSTEYGRICREFLRRFLLVCLANVTIGGPFIKDKEKKKKNEQCSRFFRQGVRSFTTRYLNRKKSLAFTSISGLGGLRKSKSVSRIVTRAHVSFWKV